MVIRFDERRVIVMMLLFALGMVLGRFVAAGLEQLAADLEGPNPGWEDHASPPLDPEFVALG